MKSVCIVGGGPGGLVSAKTLLQTKQFEVTVYEKEDRTGGIWALDQDSTGGFLNPYTPTNLSRYTVGFSDLDWNAVDFSDHEKGGVVNGTASKPRPPTFPKAWMANRYLETYRHKHIPEETVLCGRMVKKAHRTGDKWRVTIQDNQRHEETHEFDYLIMASGFFCRPRLIGQDVPSLSSNEPSVKIIHSSQFRRLEDLLPHDVDLKGKKILMLGGGNSSGETAASVAMQLSDAQWSPDGRLRDRYKGCKIVHVTPRPFYPIPHFHEYEEGSRSYVSLDMKLYDFSRRPKGQGSYAGLQTKEVKNMVHGFMQTMVGGDQSDISDALVSHAGDERGSAYVAITETYSEFARSGLIETVRGRVTGLDDSGDHLTRAMIKNGNEEYVLDDVAAVIYATGYTPIPALDMLDNETKAAVQYDPTSMRLPMILEQWQTMSPDAPNVSFIGFYEGPYWGMMEMQARLTAQRWLTGELAPRIDYEKPEYLLKVRQAFKDRALDAPQFWFGDYLGYLEDIAAHLGMKRRDNGFEGREGTISPARYESEYVDASQATAIMQDLHITWHDCHTNGKFVPRAAFRALQGTWTINRKIESALSTFPSGTLTGTASFHPRIPTQDKSGKTFDFEYLYIESGDFHTSTGYTMTASRRYVYRYREAADELSVWFVKPDRDLEVDYLFHNLDFVKPAEARKEGALVARAEHLCVRDMYETEYRLPMRGCSLREFEVRHAVKGPQKDYVSTTCYTRPPK